MSREDFQTYGFFPVYPELIIKLIEGADQVICGGTFSRPGNRWQIIITILIGNVRLFYFIFRRLL
jgi:hypothetical protein